MVDDQPLNNLGILGILRTLGKYDFIIKIIKFTCFLFFNLALSHCLFSQAFQLKILFLDSDINNLEKTIEAPAENFTDSLTLIQTLSKFIQHLNQNGYHEASVDTLVQKEQTYSALIHLGPIYTWKELDGKGTPEEWLNKSGFRKRLFYQKTLDIEEWTNLQKDLARQAANNGYPFARVLLDSITWEDEGQISAVILTKKGPLVFFEELVLEGELNISIKYIQQYLGFIPGEPYDETVIQQAQQRLQELPFIQLNAAPKVQFIANQAKLILNLDPKPASRFDFIIGVLPNSQQTGRLLITGQLEGALQNALGKGENIGFAFEQPRAQTQSLNLAFQYPYLLELPFGLDAQMNLYKRDTNYLDLNTQLAVQYLLRGDNSIQAFWSNKQTNVLSIDSTQIIQRQSLPDTLDVSRQAFGLGLVFRNLDYRHNPKKGWDLSLSMSAGQKQIQKNSAIEALGLASLYDKVKLRSAQYRITFNVANYQSISQRSVFKIALQTSAILGPEPVLVNEQFRIGGNQLLRGFDEESIFASNFELLTAEYRYILSTHSYFYAFYDIARVDSKALGTLIDLPTVDWPQGLGLGITFETRSGLFGLSLAFGKKNEQTFNFGAPKVHFGYVSLF